MSSPEPSPNGVRRWTSRVPRDVALLVAGALLALGMEEVRDARHRSTRTVESVNSIRSEIEANVSLVQRARKRHLYLIDTLEKLAKKSQKPDSNICLYGIFSPASVTDVAWTLARESGAISNLPLPSLLKLADAYDRQTRYRQAADAMGISVLEQVRQAGMAAVLCDKFTQFITLDTDFKNREALLLEKYQGALAELDKPK